MTVKTTLLAGAAAVVLAAAAAPAAFAEHGDRERGPDRFRSLPRVTAQGAAQNRSAARYEAVHNWRDKVADRFGYQYSRWWMARDKNVDCVKVADDHPSWDNYAKRGARQLERPHHYDPAFRCTVSAVPSRGWGFGFLNR